MPNLRHNGDQALHGSRRYLFGPGFSPERVSRLKPLLPWIFSEDDMTRTGDPGLAERLPATVSVRLSCPEVELDAASQLGLPLGGDLKACIKVAPSHPLNAIRRQAHPDQVVGNRLSPALR